MPDPQANPAEASRLARVNVPRVLELYAQGWFPMDASHRGRRARTRTEWVQPEERGVFCLQPGGLIVSRSLRQRVRSGRFVITSDQAFGRVIRACALPSPGREETWINEEIVMIFEALHASGVAHSVEAWLPAEPEKGLERRLVGGLYGVAVGRIFAGESMFSRPEKGGTDASKVCLVHLWHHLRDLGFQLLDAQMFNPHLASLGLVTLSRDEFLAQLATHAGERLEWSPVDSTRALRDV